MQNIRFRNEILPLKDQLFRLAFRITLNRDDAEDIVQEAMIRVWNKRDEWEQLKSLEAYCTTIVRNLALDRIERKDNFNVSLSDEMNIVQVSDTPDRQYEINEQYKLVETIISELPDIQRSIIQLRDIEGKSYKEIAEMMDLTEEQTKVYLHRARQKIKLKFNEINNYGL